MKYPKDLLGKKFGRLTIIRLDYIEPKYFKRYWLCKCDCGNTISVRRDSLINGATKSCGCLQNELHIPKEKQKVQSKSLSKKGIKKRQLRVELLQFINSYKQRPCLDCEKEFPPYVLDFDHRDESTKHKAIATMVRNLCSKEKILEEIKKCDLICSNCHRIRTHNRKNRSLL